MTERTAERVSGAETVDDLDRQGRNVGDGAVAVDGEDALGALLDDGELDPGGEQGAGGRVRLALPGGDLALVEIADGDGGVRKGLAVAGGGNGVDGVVRDGVAGVVAPEHRAPVQVEDREGAGSLPAADRSGLAPGAQRRQRGRAARFRAQAGARHPEDPGRADRVQVEFRFVDLQVGRLGLPVEVEREVVRREDLAEGHRGRIRVDRRHPSVVHPELPQLLVEIVPERVPAGARHHRRPPAEPGRRDGHIGR